MITSINITINAVLNLNTPKLKTHFPLGILNCKLTTVKIDYLEWFSSRGIMFLRFKRERFNAILITNLSEKDV